MQLSLGLVSWASPRPLLSCFGSVELFLTKARGIFLSKSWAGGGIWASEMAEVLWTIPPFGYCFLSAPEISSCSSSTLKTLRSLNKQLRSDAAIVCVERSVRDAEGHAPRKAIKAGSVRSTLFQVPFLTGFMENIGMNGFHKPQMHIVNMIFKSCNDYLLVSGQRKSVWETKVHVYFLNPRWLWVLYTLCYWKKGKEKEGGGKRRKKRREERSEGKGRGGRGGKNRKSYIVALKEGLLREQWTF